MRHLSSLFSTVALSSLFILACTKAKDDEPGDDGGSSGGSTASGGETGSGGGANTGGETASGGTGNGGTGNGGTGNGGTGNGGQPASGGTAGDGGPEPDGGGGPAPGAPGWTAIQLLDDTTDPNNTITRSTEDQVHAIRFKSLDDGWVATRGDSIATGGAIFKTTHDTVSSILLSGNHADLSGACPGGYHFYNLDPSPDGYYASTAACALAASHDGGHTFQLGLSGQEGQFGIEPVEVTRAHAQGTLFAIGGVSRYLSSTASTNPGPNTDDWNVTWAPEANPPIPANIPPTQCRLGVTDSVDRSATVYYVSPNTDFIAYVDASDTSEDPPQMPRVCISTDGGHSFFPHYLPDPPAEFFDHGPGGVVFTSNTHGIAFGAYQGAPAGVSFVYETTDGGTTWARSTLPAGAATKELEFYSAFFAPDGEHGWIVGYNRSTDAPYIVRTKDGGATWEPTGGDLGQKTSSVSAVVRRLRTGFALDANRIWVGGDGGMFLYNAAGGD